MIANWIKQLVTWKKADIKDIKDENNPSAVVQDVTDYSKMQIKEPAISVFSIKDVKETCRKLMDGIKAPFVNATFSTLGGEHNVSIHITVALEPSKDWVNGILHNADYGLFSFNRNGSVELFFGNFRKFTKFRNFVAKNVDEVISKINSYVERYPAAKAEDEKNKLNVGDKVEYNGQVWTVHSPLGRRIQIKLNDNTYKIVDIKELKRVEAPVVKEATDEKKKVNFAYTDDWGVNIYKDEKGRIYGDVDGVLHRMTSEGEPDYPVSRNWEVVNADKVPVVKEAAPTPKPTDTPPEGMIYAWDDRSNSWILVSKKASGKKAATQGAISTQYLEDLIKKNNDEYGTNFELGGAYGNYELWAGGDRLDVGSRKDIYNAFIKYRFNEKYRKGAVKTEVPVEKEASPTPKPTDTPPEGMIYAWDDRSNSWILVVKKVAVKKKSSDFNQEVKTRKFKTEQEAIDFTKKNKDMVMMDKPTPMGNWIVLYDPNGLLSDKPYVKKQALDLQEFTEENVIKELAVALDIDESDIKVMRNDDDVIEVSADGEDYAVTKDENDAYEYTVRYVREMLDENPENFNQDWLQGYLTITDTDRRIIAGEEADSEVDNMDEDDLGVEKKLIDDMTDEDILEEMGIVIAENTPEEERLEIIEGAKSDLDDKFASEYEKDLENAKEKIREERYDDIYDQLGDVVRYFVEDTGMYSIEDLMKASFISIDIEDAAVGAVDVDGIGHYLSSYDSKTYETKSGFVYWRVN